MAPRPRGRPRKSNTRKAAAIDAMKQYGFLDGIIESTIKELLNVYGEEGWVFIEDCAYKVLLEAILEKETGEGTSDAKRPAAETTCETALELACSDVNPAAETTSGTGLELECCNVNPVNTECQTSNVLYCALEATEALCSLELTNVSGKYLLPVDADVQYLWGSSNFSPLSSHNSPPPHGSNSSPNSPPPSHDSPPLEGSNSKVRRRPYYGRWDIKPDDM